MDLVFSVVQYRRSLILCTVVAEGSDFLLFSITSPFSDEATLFFIGLQAKL